MKCEVCEQEGLNWWKKIIMAFSFPLKCQTCNARYRLNLFFSVFGQLAFALFLIPIGISNYWLLDYFSWQWVLFFDLICWLLAVFIIPIQLNPRDPVNRIVQRIQEKKRHMQSADPDPNP